VLDRSHGASSVVERVKAYVTLVTRRGSHRAARRKIDVPFRSTVAVMGGVYMVGVSAEHRAGAVEVDVDLDTAPREVDVPEAGSRPLSRYGC
jgi:hypothetical protein